VRYQQPQQRSVWIRTLLAKLRAIEGVVGAGSTSGVPMRTDNEPTPLVQVEGSPERPVARRRTVSPGFFDAMGIRMRSGRAFTDDDRQTTAQVAIVNESFARRYLAGRDPLTSQISFIGIYGVIAYASAQRQSEVATRMALGASPANVFWLLVREGRALAVIGALIGAGAAYATGQLASSWLYEVSASDRLVLPIALALVLTVTMLAILIPARRASRTSPAYALSSE
jgi:hypothetical protein